MFDAEFCSSDGNCSACSDCIDNGGGHISGAIETTSKKPRLSPKCMIHSYYPDADSSSAKLVSPTDESSSNTLVGAAQIRNQLCILSIADNLSENKVPTNVL